MPRQMTAEEVAIRASKKARKKARLARPPAPHVVKAVEMSETEHIEHRERHQKIRDALIRERAEALPPLTSEEIAKIKLDRAALRAVRRSPDATAARAKLASEELALRQAAAAEVIE